MGNKLRVAFVVGFIFAFHLALTSYINSSFLSSFIPEKQIGLVFALASLGSIVSLLLIPKILKALGAYRFIILFSFLSAVSLALLSSVTNAFGIILLFVLYASLNNLITFLLDEIILIYSEGASMGVSRGLYLTSLNLAWVIAQLISGNILAGATFLLLYLISSILMFAFFVLSFLYFKNIPDPRYSTKSPLRSIKGYLHNKNLRRSYKMYFLLQFFFAWMLIYTPIYLTEHVGFTWAQTAIIFSIMLLPFVLLTYPLGKHSDKFGERNMLILGFLVMSVATICLFFIDGKSLLVWALALFMTRVGAATVEVMSDVYFFKHINKENDEYIGIYKDGGLVAHIVAPLVATGILYFVPAFSFLYLVLGAVMLKGVYVAMTIPKSDI